MRLGGPKINLYEEFAGCTVELRFLDNRKRVFHETAMEIGDVKADSAAKFSDVAVQVPGEQGDKFYVEMRLRDNRGNRLSENQYFLLVDDQQNASAVMRRLGEEARERMANGGGLVRYLEELLGDRYVPTRLLEDFR